MNTVAKVLKNKEAFYLAKYDESVIIGAPYEGELFHDHFFRYRNGMWERREIDGCYSNFSDSGWYPDIEYKKGYTLKLLMSSKNVKWFQFYERKDGVIEFVKE